MTNLETFTCNGYERVDYSHLPDINADGLMMRHTKSGARIVLIANDDPNKVFGIAFRTTPKDSTGVPHILEHSVLCGSERFPVKDPFTEMDKGSLRTFINAFTASTWTCYPCASCNDKDFKNLTHVYMDAVLRPLIYQRKEIFLQEGWHYELESPEAELGVNGIVYSEMKGAFSNPDRCASRVLKEAMYPDTTYGVESGGNPDVIPELSYEEFLEFHRTYYSPANSYIFLYGNADMADMLTFIDEEYLSKFDIIPVDSEIGMQEPFGFRRVEETYPIGEDEDDKNRTYLQLGVKVYDGVDPKRASAWDMLTSVLFSMPGAPVKKALIDAGIGSDVNGYINSDFRQPMVIVSAREANPEQADQFLAIIRDTIAGVIRDGVNRNAIEALLNRAEFNYRSTDFGGEPRGLYYAFNSLSMMIFEEDRPFDGLNIGWVFDELRKELANGYFEQLLQEFLDSDHSVLAVVKPEKGLGTKKEKELAEKLAAKKAAMSEAEIAQLVEETAALKEFQNRVETEEELSCIPSLEREDISKEPLSLEYTVKSTKDGVPVIHVDNFTGGITYIQARFDVTDLPEEELPYLKLYAETLNVMDTENYTYPEFQNALNFYTGSLSQFPESAPVKGEIGEMKGFLTSDLRVFDGGASKGLELLWEALWRTKYTDTKRLLEIISEQAAYLPNSLVSGGSRTANILSQSQFSPHIRFRHWTNQEGYYSYLRRWIDNFDQMKDEIVEHMEKIRLHILRKTRLSFGISADADGYAKALPAFEEFIENLAAVPAEDPLAGVAKLPWLGGYHFAKCNEVLTYAGAVQYDSASGNYRTAGYSYSGAFKVLETILSRDYLWTKIRVLGGAYGAGCGTDDIGGNVFMSTYRDPNLRESFEVFNGTVGYTEQLNLSDHDITRYIIGTIADMDTPYTPSTSMYTALNRYYIGITKEDVQRTRTEVLSVTNEKLRALAPMLQDVLAQNYRAALATESKAKECEDLFDVKRSLRG